MFDAFREIYSAGEPVTVPPVENAYNEAMQESYAFTMTASSHSGTPGDGDGESHADGDIAVQEAKPNKNK